MLKFERFLGDSLYKYINDVVVGMIADIHLRLYGVDKHKQYGI